eukprot:Nitzschia sp. Nitz4//scaffold178_size73299//12482//13408//NITZ4_005693-RA/size73299-processed-gene-0.24-mRNA-1//-1//CDS//3329539104//6678//frame0
MFATSRSALRNIRGTRALLYRKVSKFELRRFSSGNEPKLSKRAKRDLFLLTFGAIGAGAYLLTSNHWDDDVESAKQRLFQSAMATDSIETADNVPIPIQRYLQRIGCDLDQGNASSKLYQSDQSGEFYAVHQWFPYQATMWYHASNARPGYVWSAETTILQMPNYVLQSFVNGDANTTTKAYGKYPLIQVEEEEPYILLWLAQVPVFPHAWTQSGKLVWKSTHDLHQANATLSDGNETFQVQCIFEDNLLKSIHVTSPSLGKPWKANYSNYKRRPDGVLVPEVIEIGKGEGADFNLHYKVMVHQVTAL